MHIRLLAFGSRGDVQPYVALGLALSRAGFDVAVAATKDFKALVEGYGLRCITAEMQLQTVAEQSERGGGLRRGRRAKWAFLQMMLDETRRLAEGADVLLYAPAAIFSAPHVVEKLGIRGIPTMLQPFLHPTGDFPSVGMPWLPLGAAYNRFTYAFVEWLTWTFTKNRINRWRRETLGLPPAKAGPFEMVRQTGTAVLYGISPAVLRKPAEWPPEAHLTGYWFLPPEQNWQPPAALVEFLNAGEPPVYVGFGSMVSRNPEQMAQVVLEGIRQAGVRAVLASGWGGLSAENAPANVLLIESVPHEWLFPRMAAVVHHGGAGTTAAGLRAGVPTLAVPFKNDQPFWGAQVRRLGAGPAPIPQRALTAEKLAAAMRQAVSDTAMRQKAAALGEQIRAEDGVGNAVRLIGEQLKVKSSK